MDKQTYYGGGVIVSLTERIILSQKTRVYAIQSGSANGVYYPPISRVYKMGAPLWYIINDDIVDLNIYDESDQIVNTIPASKVGIIAYTGYRFICMIKDKSDLFYFSFDTSTLSVTITESQEDFNLRDFVNEVTDYDGITPVILTATIEDGVILNGSSDNNPAFDTGSWPSGTVVNLYNNGEILGAGGGKGVGSAGSYWSKGGDAMLLRVPLLLYNSNGRIASGGGGGATHYPAGFNYGVPVIGYGAGGGQGYVGGLSNPGKSITQSTQYGLNGCVEVPGAAGLFTNVAGFERELFTRRFRTLFHFGHGGWWGCDGEEYCYVQSDYLSTFDLANINHTNTDGLHTSVFSGAPGLAVKYAQYLTIEEIGHLTGPTMDLENNVFGLYYCEQFACNINVGKTLKKCGWNGTSPCAISIYVGPDCTIGSWCQYHPHKKDNHSAPIHGMQDSFGYRVNPYSMLIEIDFPAGTSINLENHGRIYGGGGIGRQNPYNGSGLDTLKEQYICSPDGGNAIGVYFETNIDNQGYIYGGGGGGGCKTSRLTGFSDITYWGYTYANHLKGSTLGSLATGSGGAGAGFAYGPYTLSGGIFLTSASTLKNEYWPESGQASTLTTGGRAGVGGSWVRFPNGYVHCWTPESDAGRYFTTIKEFYIGEKIYRKYYDILDFQRWGDTYNLVEWNTDWDNQPWAIDTGWYGGKDANTASGGDIGYPGNDAGDDLSTYLPEDYDEDDLELDPEDYVLGGPNEEAGNAGYSVYGNSHVTWVNTGQLRGRIGG